MAAPAAPSSRLVRTTFPVGMLQCNCTILADMDAHVAMVVDPGDGNDVQRVLNFLAERSLKLEQIVVTHAHIDHVGGAATLRRATGAPVVMDQRDIPLLKMMDIQAGWLGMAAPEIVPPDISPADGATVRAGLWRGSVLLTPGHTPGSLCLHFPGQQLLLAGDTLFAGSVGRTDLPGGNMQTLLRSIHDKLLTLPGETVVIAGHGKDTSIAVESEQNPFLQTI